MILAQLQTKSAFHHQATKNYTATDIKNKKTTRFSVQHQFLYSKTTAPTSCNPFCSSQFLRRLVNFVPPSSTATTTKCPPLKATLHASTKTWTLQGYQHIIASTDILPHSPLHLKHLNLYSYTSASPTAPMTA
jgi:hypothetical protein